jgi:hypothetical protein
MQINVSGEIFMRITLLGFYALQKGNLSVRASSLTLRKMKYVQRIASIR